MSQMPNVRPPREYTFRTSYDTAKRAQDTLLLHQTALTKDELMAGRYAAIRIADGGSDNTVYTSREEAVRHQKNNASRCFYPRIPLERLPIEAVDVLIWYARKVYDAGHREDPAFAQTLIIPNTLENLR
jgi:hypothetical protein